MTPIPAWIDSEAWQEYLDMRRRIKKPMTTRSYRDRLAELTEIKAAGYDVTYCIDSAVNGCWQKFYPVERQCVIPLRRAEADKTQEYLAQQREHAALVESQRLMRKAARA